MNIRPGQLASYGGGKITLIPGKDGLFVDDILMAETKVRLTNSMVDYLAIEYIPKGYKLMQDAGKLEEAIGDNPQALEILRSILEA